MPSPWTEITVDIGSDLLERAVLKAPEDGKADEKRDHRDHQTDADRAPLDRNTVVLEESGPHHLEYPCHRVEPGELVPRLGHQLSRVDDRCDVEEHPQEDLDDPLHIGHQGGHRSKDQAEADQEQELHHDAPVSYTQLRAH